MVDRYAICFTNDKLTFCYKKLAVSGESTTCLSVWSYRAICICLNVSGSDIEVANKLYLQGEITKNRDSFVLIIRIYYFSNYNKFPGNIYRFRVKFDKIRYISSDLFCNRK